MKEVRSIKLFLSCPGDLKSKRRSIENRITKLGDMTANAFGVSFEIVSQGKGLRGGLGKYPQAVVTQQLSDCDAYVGLMWTRVGTETPKSPSGTIEEFEFFLRWWKAHRAKLQPKSRKLILFYFLDEPCAPSLVDAEQLKGIRQFQKQLTKDGLLYKEFSTLTELTGDIDSELQAFAKSRSKTRSAKKKRKSLNSSRKILPRTSAERMSRRVSDALLKRV